MQRKSLCAAAVALALASGSAFATNGYFSHGYGTKSKGMAGAGVALPQDSLAAATNPAGLVQVGNRLDAGAALFMPFRGYKADPAGPSPNTVYGTGSDIDSDREMFLVPHFGYNTMLDANSSVGIAVYGNGGLNTFYRGTDTGGAGVFGAGGIPPNFDGNTGVDLMQLLVAPTYSRKINDKVSFGVSAILAYQRFKAFGLAPFGGSSSDPTALSNNNYDDSFGFGGRIGIQAEVSPTLTLGASYQSKIYMDEFDKYAGLFAEQGDFDIPSNFTIGLAFKPNSKWTVAADIQHIMYSDVASISNPISNFFVGAALGDDNGPGFGWDDMTIFKVGAQYAYSSDLTLRGGVSYGDQPIPSSEVLFNILAPGVMEWHLTAGATKKLSSDSELSFSVMYAPEVSVAGTHAFGAQPIEIYMSQFEAEVSYGMTW
jgi:long-chain fatty acid transport protein